MKILDNSAGVFSIPIPVNGIKRNLYFNYDTEEEYKNDQANQAKLFDSLDVFNVLRLIKNTNQIYLGGFISLKNKPIKNYVFIKGTSKKTFRVGNIIFIQNKLPRNVSKYYAINYPVKYGNKNFYKLKPEYAILESLKEIYSIENSFENKEEMWEYISIIENYTKSHQISISLLKKLLNTYIKDKKTKAKIINILTLWEQPEIEKIKLMYENYGNYDKLAINSFENLIIELTSYDYNVWDNKLKDYLKLEYVTILGSSILYDNYCFWEAYFSNYIEGIRVFMPEAYEIIKNNRCYRQNDCNILNYYQTIYGMYNKFYKKGFVFLLDNIVRNSEQFIKGIKILHKNLFKTEYSGEFKEIGNRIGAYKFVKPEAVENTLKLANDIANYYISLYYKTQKEKIYSSTNIEEQFEKLDKILGIILYLYYHAVITEVHPFDDGNGRVTRIFTNFLLLTTGNFPIIITNSYKRFYIETLHKLNKENSNLKNISSYINGFTNLFLQQQKLTFDSILENKIMKNFCIE